MSGIKDKVVQTFIEELFEKTHNWQVNSLNGENNQIRPEEMRATLLSWLGEHEQAIINPSLMLVGFDPHFNTPVELLHMISLSIVKYVWHTSHTHGRTTKNQFLQFTYRLQMSTDYLSNPSKLHYELCQLVDWLATQNTDPISCFQVI